MVIATAGVGATDIEALQDTGDATHTEVLVKEADIKREIDIAKDLNEVIERNRIKKKRQRVIIPNNRL